MRTPAASAPALIAATSATSSVGFVGVSIQTTSAPRAAARTAAVSVMSTGSELERALPGVLGEQAAHAEVAHGRDHDDRRRERVHGRRRGRHPGGERDGPSALERADGVLERRPPRRAVRAAVLAAAADVGRQHDRLVQRLARGVGSAGDDGDGRGRPPRRDVGLVGHVSPATRGTGRQRRGTRACCRRARCGRRPAR